MNNNKEINEGPSHPGGIFETDVCLEKPPDLGYTKYTQINVCPCLGSRAMPSMSCNFECANYYLLQMSNEKKKTDESIIP